MMVRVGCFYFSLVAIVGLSQAESTKETNGGCPDPLAAVLKTLDCVEKEDPTCSSEGYNAALFRKLHNDIDTNMVIDEGGGFWTQAFTLIDIGLDYNHMANVGHNMISLRYVEVVNTTTGVEFGLEPCKEHPWGASFRQHEHALVTVDDECKMVLWDQYGDNSEQTAVDDAAALILSDPAVLCLIGALPQEQCAKVDGIACGATPEEEEEEEDEDEKDDGAKSSAITISPSFLLIFLGSIIVVKMLLS